MHTYISVVVIGSQSQFCTRNILCVGSIAIHMNVNAGKVSIVTVVSYTVRNNFISSINPRKPPSHFAWPPILVFQADLFRGGGGGGGGGYIMRFIAFYHTTQWEALKVVAITILVYAYLKKGCHVYTYLPVPYWLVKQRKGTATDFEKVLYVHV